MKRVLITGVNGGIGMSLAKTFIENNYEVYGLDLHGRATHPWCEIYKQFDLDNPKWDDLFDLEFDVLINNAAIQILGNFFELSDEDIDKAFNVNLINIVKLTKRVKFTNSSNIINIGSIHSDQTKGKFSIYATTKGGLETFTKALSVELAPQTRVNMIRPAAIETPMLMSGLSGQQYRELTNYHPTKTIGDTEDVSELALYITQNKFMNGSIIDLNGGISNVLNDPDN